MGRVIHEAAQTSVEICSTRCARPLPAFCDIHICLVLGLVDFRKKTRRKTYSMLPQGRWLLALPELPTLGRVMVRDVASRRSRGWLNSSRRGTRQTEVVADRRRRWMNKYLMSLIYVRSSTGVLWEVRKCRSGRPTPANLRLGSVVSVSC